MTRKSISYEILKSLLSVKDYKATIRVCEDGNGSEVEWPRDFGAKGASNNAAAKAIRDIYNSSFQNLRKIFGG